MLQDICRTERRRRDATHGGRWRREALDAHMMGALAPQHSKLCARPDCLGTPFPRNALRSWSPLVRRAPS